MRALAGRLQAIADLLANHALHEDEHLDRLVEALLGTHAADIRAAHDLLEHRIVAVVAVVAVVDAADAAVAVAPGERRAAVHHVYLELGRDGRHHERLAGTIRLASSDASTVV